MTLRNASEQERNTNNPPCTSKTAECFEIEAPVSGEVVSLRHVPDQIFSSGMMGKGIAILPKSGHVVAPCDGEVMYNRNFLHMIGVVADSGAEILIHIGLNAAERAAARLKCHVKEQQTVKKGDLLMTVNLDAVRKAGQKLYTPVIITNSDRYSSFVYCEGKTVRAGERLMTVS